MTDPYCALCALPARGTVEPFVHGEIHDRSDSDILMINDVVYALIPVSAMAGLMVSFHNNLVLKGIGTITIHSDLSLES
jgi:hypothetical protein